MTNGNVERPPPATTPRLAPWKIYALIGAVLAGVAIVNGQSAVADAARVGGRTTPLSIVLFWELSSVAVVFALAPLIRWGAAQVRGTGIAALLGGLAVNVALILLFSALHIAGMVLLRKLGHAAAGLGPYGFDASFATLVYEVRKDALTYLLLAATFWLNDNAQAQAPSPPLAMAEPASPAADTGFWLRDGASATRIDPAAIVWVQSAGNYVEYCLADGRRHLIRATLRAEEQRLLPYGIVRVHRTRLVNPTRVARIEMRPSGDAELTLDTGETIAASRRFGIGDSLKQAAQGGREG
ncbi:putative two-component response-regulatory protein YehT [bacterium YEK0313]|nr:putative two-component response-regulatory protein YehT [bacterium YEK0313]